jgi:osmotically inducible protein OsmC
MEPNMKVAYTAHATATGGREGHSRTDDGKVDVNMTPPKELGGSGTGVNPEQLFATGYSACYLGAIKFAAGKEKIKISDDAKVTAHVGIGERDDKEGFGLTVELEVSLPSLDKAKAEELAKKGHVVCPYSHATRGNISVKTKVV